MTSEIPRFGWQEFIEGFLIANTKQMNEDTLGEDMKIVLKSTIIYLLPAEVDLLVLKNALLILGPHYRNYRQARHGLYNKVIRHNEYHLVFDVARFHHCHLLLPHRMVPHGSIPDDVQKEFDCRTGNDRLVSHYYPTSRLKPCSWNIA